MDACKENNLQILLDLLDEAESRNIDLCAGALEPLLETFNITPGSTEHFVLVWSDFSNKKRIGKNLDIQSYEGRFPHWKDKFQGLLKLEKMMGTLQDRSIENFKYILQKQNWNLVSILNHNLKFVTCLVQRQSHQTPVVVKFGKGGSAKRQLDKEFKIGTMMNGRGFVKYMGYGAAEGTAWIATEYATLGSLAFREGALDPNKVWDWWLQAASALGNLHERNYCHNDVKASNILLTLSLSGEERILMTDLQHSGKIGKPVHRMEDFWDHPEWTSSSPARRGDDVYRLAMTVAWLLDPAFCDSGMSSTTNRLNFLSRLPERFRLPLEQCLLDKFRCRIENCMELERILKSY